MYTRIINPPQDKSFFLFGPRGTGKTTWLRFEFNNALYLDLLESSLYYELLANPNFLEKHIPNNFKDWVILDEVQRIPDILREVHRLIESKKIKFILTGSSARALKRKNVDLLAGRALTLHMFPLTAIEAGKDFNLEHALTYGSLPAIYFETDPKAYLQSYIKTYLREEVQQEGLTRNLGAFTRFLEAASFSQGSVLNVSEVSRECAVDRKIVENYFSITEDLLIAKTLPVFTKKAKRRLINHPKFYFFDAGVYRALRPMGPFDRPEEAEGIALETLIFQQIRAINEYFHLNYSIYYWRTSDAKEIDFVLYGEKGLVAIEVKRSKKIHDRDLSSIKAFLQDYPIAKTYVLYGGEKTIYIGQTEIIPVETFLHNIPKYL